VRDTAGGDGSGEDLSGATVVIKAGVTIEDR
jgi:hypothetical protein